MIYELTDLSVAIGGKPLVQQVSLSVAAGGCTALIGASGSGKSLTSFAPFGLVAADVGGSARLGNIDLLQTESETFRQARTRDVGFIYQQPLTALTPHLTVRQHLVEAATQAGAPAPDNARLERMLGDVGLPDPAAKLAQFPHRLSGGERQRVMVAMAIAHQPKLLVADEPTSALDAALRGAVMELLIGLCRDRAMGLLLVSHDLPAVERHADQVVVLEQGNMVESGPPDRVIAAPAEDYTKALVAATPRLAEAVRPKPEPGEKLLDICDLSVRFRRPGTWRRQWIDAVNGVSFDMRKGEALGLVGGSGSGKSTIGRAIAGLGPVTSGDILWDGAALPARAGRTEAHRRLVQPVFQDPLASLDPRWSVADIITEPLRKLRPELTKAQWPALVADLLEQVGLDPDLAERRPRTLSGGQAQRVAIARALAADPQLLILDEATSALDPLAGGAILDLLSRLQAEHGLSILMISHDIAAARRLCHRIAVLDAGRLVEIGESESLVSAPKTEVARTLVTASM